MLTDELRSVTSNITTSVGKTLGSMGVTANQITFLVLITGLVSAYLITQGYFYCAILLFLFSGILDGLDGAVAKANNKETKFGGLFDSTTDKTTEIMVYIALGIYNPDFWLPASLAIAFFMLSSYISKHAKASGGKSGGGIMERKERMILLILGMFFMDYMIYSLYAIAILSIVTAIQRFYKNYQLLK